MLLTPFNPFPVCLLHMYTLAAPYRHNYMYDSSTKASSSTSRRTRGPCNEVQKAWFRRENDPKWWPVLFHNLDRFYYQTEWWQLPLSVKLHHFNQGSALLRSRGARLSELEDFGFHFNARKTLSCGWSIEQVKALHLQAQPIALHNNMFLHQQNCWFVTS